MLDGRPTHLHVDPKAAALRVRPQQAKVAASVTVLSSSIQNTSHDALCGGSCVAETRYRVGVKIVFADAFDDGAWPGPLGGGGERSAVLDEVWVGPRGLSDVLEVRIGLLSLEAPRAAERVADLARKLRHDESIPGTPDRLWSRSLAIDPLATARELLSTRDALLDLGVDGGVDVFATLPPRLAAIQVATRHSLPGDLDRTRDVAVALEGGARGRIDTIEVIGDEAALSPLSRRLLRALEQGGTAKTTPTVTARREDDTNQDAGAGENDLSRARRGVSGAFAGDGSLLLLRPDAAVDAADEVAAFLGGLAAQRALVVGADAGLDEALHRRRAGTLGISGHPGDDSLLALLPLVLAVGVPHPDPQRLFELAALPLSPLPRSVGAGVRRALLHTPSAASCGVRGAFNAALSGLFGVAPGSVNDDDAALRLLKVRERLLMLVPAFSEHVDLPSTTTLPVSALLPRLAALLGWLQERQAREWLDQERTPYRAAIAQVTLCRRLLLALDLPLLTAPQLLRLIESATEGTQPLPRHEAEAAHHKLARPEGMCGGADIVVWWNFNRESARLGPGPFNPDETRALTIAGFAPPAAAVRTREHARCQRRPLDYTRGRLILCCPRRGDDGRELHPHPLWDELMALLPNSERRSAARALTRPEDSRPGLVPRTTPLPTTWPSHRVSWRIPVGSVEPNDVRSPAAEEMLLRCGFRAALQERGLQERGLRGRTLSLPRGSQLEDQVLHALLSRVLAGHPTSALMAAAAARGCFDDVIRERAGAWLRPGQEQTRLRVRERGARAAAALLTILIQNNYVISAVEQEIERELPPGSAGERRVLKGTPDVVVDGPLGRLIIDHRTADDAGRRESLMMGTALQLIDFTVMAGEKGTAWPQSAFFQVRSRLLLTTDPRIVGAEVVGGPRQKASWALLEEARLRGFAALRAGEIEAPGADGSAPLGLPILEQGRLRLPAPCHGCAADVLCGRAFALMMARAGIHQAAP